MIASRSKKSDDQDVVFFVPFVVAVVAADKGVIHPCNCLLTLTPSRRRRGGDPSLSKPQSADDNKDNNALIASAGKNEEDHLQSLLGLQTTVELLAQP
jgi:hypothetical protein